MSDTKTPKHSGKLTFFSNFLLKCPIIKKFNAVADADAVLLTKCGVKVITK